MVYLFLANGFEETEAIAPLDLLKRAGVDVKTVAVGTENASLTVTGAHGIPVTADVHESQIELDDVNGVILPGGLPGADNLYASEHVKTALETANANGAVIGAICAAPYILGKRGYLAGKRAVCFPGFENDLVGACVTDAPAVTDGNIITGKAMGAAIPFGLALVTSLCGKEAADKIAAAIHAI